MTTNATDTTTSPPDIQITNRLTPGMASQIRGGDRRIVAGIRFTEDGELKCNHPDWIDKDWTTVALPVNPDPFYWPSYDGGRWIVQFLQGTGDDEGVIFFHAGKGYEIVGVPVPA